jgi:hypothetical protein
VSGAESQHYAGFGGMAQGMQDRLAANGDPSALAYRNYSDSYGNGIDRLWSTGGEGIMPYSDYRRLYYSMNPRSQTGSGGTAPPPVTPPAPSDALQGLMAQAADPYGTYGQLGVANPYLQNIQNRFGYDPSGLAYGVNLQQSPSWYLPGIAHPNVVYPAITGGSGGGSTRS